MSAHFKGSTPGLHSTNTSKESFKSTTTTSDPSPVTIPPQCVRSQSLASASLASSSSPIESVQDESHAFDSEKTQALPPTKDEESQLDVTRTATRSTQAPDGNEYPEGGLSAWLVVFGSFCGLLAALGIMNTIGM